MKNVICLLSLCVMMAGCANMQNTTTPKLYVSEKSAKSAAEYHGAHYNNGVILYKPVKAFLVVDDELGEDF